MNRTCALALCLLLGANVFSQDYIVATAPNPSGLSTVTGFQYPNGPFNGFTTQTIRQDIPGRVIAIEPKDGADGDLLLLVQDANGNAVYELLSPFLGGPFAPNFTPLVRYRSPSGGTITDVKAMNGGGFLTVERGANPVGSLVVQRHAANGSIAASVNISFGTTGHIGFNPANGDVFYGDNGGVFVHFDNMFNVISTSNPAASIFDVIFAPSAANPTTPLVLAATPFGGSLSAIRASLTGTLGTPIVFGGGGNIVDSLSVDDQGAVVARIDLGGTGMTSLEAHVSPSGTLTLLRPGVSNPIVTAISWTGRHAMGRYFTSRTTLLTHTPQTALVGDADIRYSIATPLMITAMAYGISTNYLFGTGAILGPNAEMLIDTGPTAVSAIISVPPVQNGGTLIATTPVTPSLNGQTFYTQILAIDNAGTLVTSNGASQTFGLRPVE